MATHDRFPRELELQPITQPSSAPQGELFARIALRQLPIMKHGPEDEVHFTPRTTMH